MDERNGVILSYYLDTGVYQENQNNREKFPYLSWSPYDRIEIKPVDSFSQFFQAQFQTRWTGVAQQMHLIYDYPEICLWKYHNQDSSDTHCLIKTDRKKVFGLCCVITVRFVKTVKNSEGFRGILYQNLREVLKKIYGEQVTEIIEWAAFYSLGAEDMVFIVLADAIDIFQIFIDILCKIEIEGEREYTLVSSLSSFVNVNDSKWNGNPKADLNIRLTLKNSTKGCIERTLSKLKEKGIPEENIHRILLGKCIFDVKIPASDKIMEYYKGKQGIFNGSSRFYRDNISSSRSYWIVNTQNNIDSFCIKSNIEISSDNIADGLKLIRKNEKPSDYFKEYPLAQFVLKEYERMIVSENSASWRNILVKQYAVVRHYIFDYIEHNQVEKIFLLLKQVQNVLLHIRQSTIPVAEVPYHNYTYAGSYHDILKMYYGIISSLLTIGYQMGHDDKTLQYEIIYCVDFESTSKLHSDMYVLSDISYNKRFVVFHLPFEAFTDIETTVRLLIHEVFHYIAPFSRAKRNRRLLEIWSVSVFKGMLKVLYDDYQIPDEVIVRIMRHISEHFAEVDKKIYEVIKNIKELELLDDFILNDFIRDNSKIFQMLYLMAQKVFTCYWNKMFQIPEEDFSLIYRGMTGKDLEKPENDDLELQKLLEPIYKEFKGKMFNNDKFLNSLSADIKVFALASKEAFCDLNMIKLFDMNVGDYLHTFYKLLFGKYKNLENSLFKIEEGEIEIDWLERRLGLIIDTFYGTEDSYAKFSKEIRESVKLSMDETYKQFIEYCIKCYALYSKNDGLIQKKYLQLLDRTINYWERVNLASFDEIQDIRKILKAGNTIKGNLDVITLFIDKEVMKNSPVRKNPVIGDDSYNKSMSVAVKGFSRGFVTSLGEYIDEACKISNYMKQDSKDIYQECWFRGVCNSEYSLLPSLQRSFDNEAEKKIRMSPYAYQTKILKDAYFLTISTPSLWTEQLHGIAEHTCCLQHYGMLTNLLDFSLDMLVALHFALNPDAPKDKDAMEMKKYVPKVVIFNPVKYSKAILSLREGHVIDERGYAQFSPVMSDWNCSETKEYFVDDMSADFCVKSTEEFFDGYYVPSDRINKYPKPVIIWQSNSRVQAQNGIFMAYNLHAKRNIGNEPFSYLDLRNIQNSFLGLISDVSRLPSEKFLEEIYISPYAIEQIRKELFTMRIRMPKMYPELSKIFDDYRYSR